MGHPTWLSMKRRMTRMWSWVFAGALLWATTAGAAGPDFVDPLALPAKPSRLAQTTLVNGLAQAGQAIVAVGQRGHILVSQDSGRTWAQAAVPVSSDLVAAHFPTPLRGWAAGHDGVVLASADGGLTWARQLDGHQAGKTMAVQYATADERLRDEGKRFAEQGPDKPFLDVWFENEKTGFVVGAFNLIFRTDDGGASWQSWFDRVENPRQLHLHAIRAVGAEVFIVGEQGLVLKLDRQARRFRALPTPYQGSYFGVTGTQGAVVIHGLRGHVYRSVDAGASWERVETGLSQAITASATAADGRILLASQGGQVLVSDDGAASFRRIKVERPVPGFAISTIERNAVVIAGLRGVQLLSIGPGQ
jgi:photosystem II stability/assembly factor-like uncharacterized protein